MRNLILKSVLVGVFSIIACANMSAQEVKKTPQQAEVASPKAKEVAQTTDAKSKKECKSGCEKACCATKDDKKASKTKEKEVTKENCCSEEDKKSSSNKKKVAEAKSCKKGCKKSCCVG